MFHNAKFSDRVFKDLPDNVARNIRNDLNFVLRKDEPNEIRRWNRVASSQSTIEPESQIRKNSVRNLRYQQIARPFVSQVLDDEGPSSRKDTGFRTARELLQQQREKAHATTFADDSYEVPHGNFGRKITTRSSTRRSQSSTTVEQTPTVFRTPDDPKLVQKKENIPIFPVEPDLKMVAEGILEGLPHLALKNNDSTTYSEATNGILRKALGLFFDLKDWSSKPEGVVAANSKTFDLDPAKQMLNQTAPFNISKSTNNSFQMSLLSEESPLAAASLLSDSEVDQHMSICSIGSHEGEKKMEEEMYSMNKEFDEIDRTFVVNDEEPFAYLNTTGGAPVKPFMGFKFNDSADKPAEHNSSFNVSMRRTLYSQTVQQPENVFNLSTDSLEKPTFLSPSVVLSARNSFLDHSVSKRSNDVSYDFKNLNSNRKRPAEGSPLFRF